MVAAMGGGGQGHPGTAADAAGVAVPDDLWPAPETLFAERQATARTRRSRIRVWRSPPGQPRYSRPALLTLALLAGLSYGWDPNGTALEPYYAAAARSMGGSWHDFVFGAVDPLGTISVDKLPGALWVQALSVRAFGFHVWAVALPQALEGALAVLVLYRAVRRLAGPKPAIVAAVVLAASPAAVLLNRGNVSDSLLVLLTVLAADAASHALTSGRLRHLVLAGVWVGLAFQTKMVQAWLVLPALFGVYLVAARPALRRRLAHVAAAGAACAVVSLSWMSAVSLANPAHRPYVDGSNDDSLFVQVFVYNGTARVGLDLGRSLIEGPKTPFIAAAAEANPQAGTSLIRPRWDRLLAGPFGRDIGWLLPAAAVAGTAVLWTRRRSPRTDPVRAAALLWGGWLVTLFAAFSAGTGLNAYYTAALAPAVAVLCALGAQVLWRAVRTSPRTYPALGALVALSAVYSLILLRGATFGPQVVAVIVAAAAAAVAAAALAWARPPAGDRARLAPLVIGCLSLLAAPATASASVAAAGLGSFATPFQSPAATQENHVALVHYQDEGSRNAAVWAHLKSRYVAAYATMALAAPQIMVTGREFLGIGGFSGRTPSPTLAQLRQLVASGQLAIVVVPVRPAGDDPRLRWVRQTCQPFQTAPFATVVELGIYVCGPMGRMLAGL